MATIKSFTDLQQSKKLAKILPLESADMYWDYDVQKHEDYPMIIDDQFDDLCTPAWSLAALIAILSEINGVSLKIEKLKAKDGYDGYYYPIQYEGIVLIPYSKNPVDACYEMILKLKESDLL